MTHCGRLHVIKKLFRVSNLFSIILFKPVSPYPRIFLESYRNGTGYRVVRYTNMIHVQKHVRKHIRKYIWYVRYEIQLSFWYFRAFDWQKIGNVFAAFVRCSHCQKPPGNHAIHYTRFLSFDLWDLTRYDLRCPQIDTQHDKRYISAF